MDISPKLLRDVEFREQRKGYSPDQVDDFLERLAVGVGQLQEQLKEATARAEEAERRSAAGSQEEGITRTLVLAQRTADAALLEARQEAAATTAEAQERAATMVAEAQEQAASLVSTAEERAAASDRAAAERAASVVSEAESRVANELAPLLAQRDALQQDVEALRSWAAEIRARMADELRQQLAWLDGDGADLPGAPPVLEMELPVPEGAAAPADEHQDEASDDEQAPHGAQAEGGPEAGHDEEAEPERDTNGLAGRPAIGVLDAEHRARVEQGDHGVEGGPLATAAADDPFLAELRLAVTDDEPLGPRDPVTTDVDHGDDDDDLSSSMFRRKKRH